MTFALKRLVWPIAILGLAGLVVMALRPTPLRVDMGEAQRGPMQVTVDAEGKTRLRHRYTISAPVSGRLARLEVEEGDRVASGQAIAHIDPLPVDTAIREAQARLREWQAQLAGVATQRPKQDALRQAQARIDAARAAQRSSTARVEQSQAALEQARRDRQRAERLEAKGTLSREAREAAELAETSREKDYEAALLAAQGAAAEVQAAEAAFAVLREEQRDPDYLLDVYEARMASVEAELARLKDEASRTSIHAPVDGQILRVLQEDERVVQAGTPLLEVGNLNDLELVVDVLSTDAVRVRPGDKIIIEHWGGERTLLARVRLIEPAAFTEISALGVEEQRVNIIGDFIKMPVPLGDGYRVEARIVVWEGSDVLQVPLSALFRCDQVWCVFVVEDDQVQVQKIEIGQRNDVAVEVRHGLSTSETVVLHPSEQVEDGSRVLKR